ncbi:MAG: HAMP domain-containing sensor histidine kinase [Rhodothermales bacterium]|nr:HAMP domain-containing sensor histidine kinase [Rhodothermales bacterium]
MSSDSSADPQLVFAGSLSHELRAPLAAILGYTQLLWEELEGRLEPHQREFFKTILSSVEQSLDLVNELVEFSRILSGRHELRIAPVALNALCDDVVHQLYPTAERKGLTLEVEDSAGLLYVAADVQRLRQVLVNLIQNAIKYTESGEVVLQLSGDGVRVAIQVRDTGRGISAEFMPRLFERFSREERMTEVIQQGAGIGLAVALEYVILMAGTIDVQSAPGEGSTFTITLPRASLSGW